MPFLRSVLRQSRSFKGHLVTSGFAYLCLNPTLHLRGLIGRVRLPVILKGRRVNVRKVFLRVSRLIDTLYYGVEVVPTIPPAKSFSCSISCCLYKVRITSSKVMLSTVTVNLQLPGAFVPSLAS